MHRRKKLQQSNPESRRGNPEHPRTHCRQRGGLSANRSGTASRCGGAQTCLQSGLLEIPVRVLVGASWAKVRRVSFQNPLIKSCALDIRAVKIRPRSSCVVSNEL